MTCIDPKETCGYPGVTYSGHKVTYSDPKSYSDPKVTYINPKVNYSGPKLTYSDPTHLTLPQLTYLCQIFW